VRKTAQVQYARLEAAVSHGGLASADLNAMSKRVSWRRLIGWGTWLMLATLALALLLRWRSSVKQSKNEKPN
jgi:hypothetical protein